MISDKLQECQLIYYLTNVFIYEVIFFLLVPVYYQLYVFTGSHKKASEEMKHVLGQLVGLNSPNSILKAAKVNIFIFYLH